MWIIAVVVGGVLVLAAGTVAIAAGIRSAQFSRLIGDEWEGQGLE